MVVNIFKFLKKLKNVQCVCCVLESHGFTKKKEKNISFKKKTNITLYQKEKNNTQTKMDSLIDGPSEKCSLHTKCVISTVFMFLAFVILIAIFVTIWPLIDHGSKTDEHKAELVLGGAIVLLLMLCSLAAFLVFKYKPC